MARYDRLRNAGMGPVEAMREAAPLFARPPFVHDLAPKLALTAGNGWKQSWSLKMHGPSREEFDALIRDRRDERARQIAQRLRDRTGHDGEVRTMLEATTNLPSDVIARVAPAGAAGQPRAPWRDDFPFPIEAVLAARPAPRPTRDMADQGISRGRSAAR